MTALARMPAAVMGLLLLAGPALAQESRHPSSPDPPMPSVHRFSVRALVAVDVTGRLVVRDPLEAGVAIAQFLARLGGVQLARRIDALVPGGEIVELLIPREAYRAFVAELARLGRWVVEQEAAELPDQVRMVLHVS